MKTALQRQIAIGALMATAAMMPYSVQLCHWSFLLFVLFWIAAGEWTIKWSLIKNNPLSWLMPAFFILHLAGMLYTTQQPTGWFELEKKAAFVLVPLTLASIPRLTRKELGGVVRVFILSCAVAALYCVGHAGWIAINTLPQNNFGEASIAEFQRLNPGASPVWMSFSYISLASGIQGHPTYFGLYLILCLLLILFFFRKEETRRYERVTGRVIFSFFLIFIFFLSSRIATLCAVVVTMVAAATRLSRKSEGRAFAMQAGLVILFLFLIYINPVSRFRGLQEPATASLARLPDYAVTSIEIRLSLLKLSGIAAGTRPWFGSGTGTAEDRLRVAGTQNHMSNSLGSYDPHNQFIFTYLELGLLGLAGLVCMMLSMLHSAWKNKKMTLTGFLLVFIAVCLTESALELQKGIILFAFFGSLLLFHEMTPQTRSYDHA